MTPDPSYYRSSRAEMLPFVPSGTRRFLEVGCGAGGFGELLRRSIVGSSVTGIELHAESAALARGRLDHVIEAPAEQAIVSLKGGERFDCVVCNDILEHLVDPWQVLLDLRDLIEPSGYVVASIPNVRHFPVFKDYFLGGDWRYEKWGVLDRTHLRFFTKSSATRLFTECGYELFRIEGIFGQPLPWKASLLNLVTGGKLDDMRFERFASVSRLRA